MKISPEDRNPSTAPDGHIKKEMLGLGTLNITKYSVAHIVAPAGSRGMTRQNQFDEIIIVISGRGTAHRDYVTDELGPEDVLLLPAGTRYSIEADLGEDLVFWAVCVPAYRPEWSNAGEARRDWRDYQVPRGSDRLRPRRDDEI
jgi:mannose-6-phosphate isomerase-like protein (cupin superfamily)